MVNKRSIAKKLFMNIFILFIISLKSKIHLKSGILWMRLGRSALRQLEDAASIMTAEVVCQGPLVKNRMGDESIFVVDIRERIDVVAPLHETQEIGDRKDPVSIELDPLFADGNGKIEFTALFQHPVYVVPADEMTSIVQTIPITSEAEVLHSMKAGKRVAVIDKREILSREVCPGKTDICNIEMKATDIKNLDLTERRNVGHEPVDTGTDIDMPCGVYLKNLLGNEEILEEVMLCDNTAFFILFFETGIKLCEGEGFPCLFRLAPDLCVFPQKGGKLLQEDKQGHPLDRYHETHERY
jgi:hypothetical protein